MLYHCQIGFHFPSTLADVEAALEAKRMTSTARQAFIGKIASAMLCYKCYPTSSDYENVSRSVVNRNLELKYFFCFDRR